MTPPDAAIPPRSGGRRKRGRPPLLDSYAREVLLEALRAGNRLTVAARVAGVGSTTVEEWMRRGRGYDKRPATPFYVEFVKDVELAQAEAERTAVDTIHRSMRLGDTKAAMWFLERQAGWRPPQPVGGGDPEGGAGALVPAGPGPLMPPGSNVIILSPDAVERLAREHLSAAREDHDGRDAQRAARARLVEDVQPA